MTTDPDEIVMSLDQAISIVARHVLWAAADDEPLGWWESYPDIGEDDWVSVMNEVGDLTPPPDAEEYKRAYAILEARADHE